MTRPAAASSSPFGRPQLDAYLRAQRERHVAELLELLRIPSVSALPAHAPDVRRAARWLTDALARAGASASEVIETSGHPLVLGEWRSARADAPTVLIYGHFDVQPADPLEAWSSPPFEPVVRDDRVYARGASDDKGNLLVPVRAAEALAAVDEGLPVNLVFLFEGEEEIGSPSLPAFLAEQRERLRADAALSADGIMLDLVRPTVMLGFKGLLSLELHVSGAAQDVHSGLHGGLAPNAASGLAQLLATLVAPDGTVLVEGFDAGAAAVTERQRERAGRFGFDARAYLAGSGARELWGDPRHAPTERNWFRPTLDVNGIWSGFQGPGTKTVIPAHAAAKITCRLAPGQVPDEIVAALRRHVARHTPPAFAAELRTLGDGFRGFSVEPEHPVTCTVRETLRDAYGLEPLDVHAGSSLPVAGMLEDALGLKTVMLGWSMLDERLHAPDEFVRLEELDRGARVYAELLERLAGVRAGVPTPAR